MSALLLLLLPALVPAHARDSDGDGLRNRKDACPEQVEDADGHRDEDGCPDPDNDGDGLPDADDPCPDRPEDIDRWQDEDGCPEPGRDPALGPSETELVLTYQSLVEAAEHHLQGCDAFAAAVEAWLEEHGETFPGHLSAWRARVSDGDPGDASALRLGMMEEAWAREITSVSLTCTGHDRAMKAWDELYEVVPPVR